MHGNVSPQYHTEFDDNLLTVPTRKTVLSLNWRISSNTQLKIAIATAFELAESWLAGTLGEVASDPLSDPLLLCLIHVIYFNFSNFAGQTKKEIHRFTAALVITSRV